MYHDPSSDGGGSAAYYHDTEAAYWQGVEDGLRAALTELEDVYDNEWQAWKTGYVRDDSAGVDIAQQAVERLLGNE